MLTIKIKIIVLLGTLMQRNFLYKINIKFEYLLRIENII